MNPDYFEFNEVESDLPVMIKIDQIAYVAETRHSSYETLHAEIGLTSGRIIGVRQSYKTVQSAIQNLLQKPVKRLVNATS